ncbi:MAG: hypothetical protein BGO03_11950 [Mesorhizobium sp. 61-13]|nr:MAG: hypothetical protein BGO03_11950 [Mesorhizobium sp. 61-13]
MGNIRGVEFRMKRLCALGRLGFGFSEVLTQCTYSALRIRTRNAIFFAIGCSDCELPLGLVGLRIARQQVTRLTS